MDKYKAGVVSVTTGGSTVTPDFDAEYVDIYAVDGDIKFRIKNKAGWGDYINVYEGTAVDVKLNVDAVEIVSLLGTVSVEYLFTEK